MRDWVRNVLNAVIGAAVLTLTVVWLSGGCHERIAPDDLAPGREVVPASARVGVVEAVTGPLFEQASGTVSSAHHTTISSSILARIEEIPVRAGSVVARGDLVVRLDSRDLGARLKVAREGVTSAQAALALARSEQQRIAGLYESKVASRQQLDHAVAALQVAQSDLDRAEQQVADAQVGLSHGEIRSPVAGRVVDRLAEPGDTAAPGAPLLRIYDPGAMRLEAPVRESLATRLRPGQSLRVEIESLGIDRMGEIDEIVPAAEPGARTFLVKVRLPADVGLFSGMFGRVSIPAGEGERLLVDPSAIERIGQLEFARVANDDGTASRRLVTTGLVSPSGGVEVLSGLAAGERVVLR